MPILRKIRSPINNLILLLKTLEEEDQRKAKESRRKKIINTREEVNKIEYRNINVHWRSTGILDENMTVEARRDRVIWNIYWRLISRVFAMEWILGLNMKIFKGNS